MGHGNLIGVDGRKVVLNSNGQEAGEVSEGTGVESPSCFGMLIRVVVMDLGIDGGLAVCNSFIGGVSFGQLDADVLISFMVSAEVEMTPCVTVANLGPEVVVEAMVMLGKEDFLGSLYECEVVGFEEDGVWKV